MNRMLERYQKEAVPALQKDFNFRNIMEVPRIEKVVVDIGLGEAMDDSKALEAALTDLSTITGQKPIQTKSRKDIANFKLRAARISGSTVPFRGDRVWAFLGGLWSI